MENETKEQQRIKELESKNFLLKQQTNELEQQLDELKLINLKLGYSVRLMSEFHLTQNDKEDIANSIDLTQMEVDIVNFYNEYKKLLNNKNLNDDMDEYQMSPNFKDNLMNYLMVSLGENPFDKIADNVIILKNYFDFENKIRSTPDKKQRDIMTDTLLKSRPEAVGALNTIIDKVNEFISTQNP